MITILLNDFFDITASFSVPASSSGVNLPMSYGYIITGTQCVEFVSQDPLPMNVVGPVSTTFRGIKTGNCNIAFYLYITGFPITSGVPIISKDVKVLNKLQDFDYNTLYLSFAIFFVGILTCAIFLFLKNRYNHGVLDKIIIE